MQTLWENEPIWWFKIVFYTCIHLVKVMICTGGQFVAFPSAILNAKKKFEKTCTSTKHALNCLTCAKYFEEILKIARVDLNWRNMTETATKKMANWQIENGTFWVNVFYERENQNAHKSMACKTIWFILNLCVGGFVLFFSLCDCCVVFVIRSNAEVTYVFVLYWMRLIFLCFCFSLFYCLLLIFRQPQIGSK